MSRLYSLRVSPGHCFRANCGNREAKASGFPKVRRDLLDAVFVLLISAADLATGIVVLNITEISRQLSPVRPDGSPDPSQYVVVSRLSRLLNELERFGILENPRPEFDFTGKVRFPKHVIITDLGWSLTGIDMARFRHEREVRLNNEALKEAYLQSSKPS